MGAEDNAPLTGTPPGDDADAPAGRRRGLGLVFSLLVIAALLIVAALLVRTSSRTVVHPGDPHPQPIPSGPGAPPGVAQPPGP